MANLQREELLIRAVLLECPPLSQLLKFAIALISLESREQAEGLPPLPPVISTVL